MTSSEGLLVVSAKIHEKSQIAKLLITDLVNNAQVWIDVKNEKLLYGDVKLQEMDIKRVCKEIKNQQLSFDDKLLMALAGD